MTSRKELSFWVIAVIGIVLVAALMTAFPGADYFGEEVAAQVDSQPVKIQQQSDPKLVVPESTMAGKPQRDIPNWDDNPVATIPESTMRYPHNWGDNPVATVPESTMGENSQ